MAFGDLQHDGGGGQPALLQQRQQRQGANPGPGQPNPDQPNPVPVPVQPVPVQPNPVPVPVQPVAQQRVNMHQGVVVHQQPIVQQQPIAHQQPMVQQQPVVQQQVVAHQPVMDYTDLQSLSATLQQKQVTVTDNGAFFLAHSITMQRAEGLFKGFKERSKEKTIKSSQTQRVRQIAQNNAQLIKKVDTFCISFNKLKDKLDADTILPLREKDARLARFVLPFADDINNLNGLFAPLVGEFQGSLSLNIARFYHEFSIIQQRINITNGGQNPVVQDYETPAELEKARAWKAAKDQAAAFLHRDVEQKVDKAETPLSAQQEANLKELDQWLIRHAHDSKSPFEKIVNTLLQKTPRERFFVYYLIANKKEETGNISDCINSYDATIDINVFEKNMSSSFKIFRTKGGAYKWDKIEKAIQTGLGLSLPMSLVSGVVLAPDKTPQEVLDDELQGVANRRAAKMMEITQNPALNQQQQVEAINRATIRYDLEEAGLTFIHRGQVLLRDLSELGAHGDFGQLSPGVKDKIKEFIKSYAAYSKSVDDFKAAGLAKAVKVEGTASKFIGLAGITGSAVMADTMSEVSLELTNALKSKDMEAAVKSLEPLTKTSTAILGWGSSGLSIVSGLFGILAGVGMTMGAFKSAKGSDWSDNLVSFIGATATITGGAKSLISGIKTASLMGLSVKFTEVGVKTMQYAATATTGLGFAKAGMDFLSMGANSISVIKRGHNIKSATRKLAQQHQGFNVETDQSEEARLLRLSKNIKKKKTCDAIVSGVNLAFSVVSVCPIGLLASLCVTGAGIVTTMALSKFLGSKFGAGVIKEKAVNDIFDPNVLFGPGNVAQMKPKELQKQISIYATEAAASMGMSKDRLFNAIICQHAENIYQKLFFDAQGNFNVNPAALTNDQEVYADIAGSYGCSVKFDADIKKCKPTRQTLISKMMKM